MNRFFLHYLPGATCVLGLVLGSNSSTALAKGTPKTGARTIPGIPSVPEVPLPQSVFNIPSQPSEGRNPFFPQSTVQVVIAKISKANPVESFSFVLNGITSPPRRSAMINGRTFEPGEEGEVRLPSGAKVLIKCEEIKDDSAVIIAGGQRRELRLRSGL